MSELGRFFGVGVGPGHRGYIAVAALDALKQADLIFYPRARSAETSVAKQCLAGLNIAEEKFREVVYNMDKERAQIDAHYGKLAEDIAIELRQGKSIAYLTIGDALTYSTYSYTIAALLKLLPTLSHQTFPGITSYAAVAAAFNYPLGQGKERTLILPCPDDMADLERDIRQHDLVVLMKIAHRLPKVLALIKSMAISQNCLLGSRIGLPGELLCNDLEGLPDDDSLGYLSTMLIRENPPSELKIPEQGTMVLGKAT
jgi:precorrin-2/cobalt-factor-2 C20-methyltransferase